MTDASTIIRVFISYSHDSDAHAGRALGLATSLRRDGIEAVIDQHDPHPAQGWIHWMEEQLEQADFVLMVCTETYLERVKRKQPEGTGLGATWEAALIYQELYNSALSNEKFLPVTFSPKDKAFIPLPLQCFPHWRLNDQAGYDALFRRLIGHKDVPPEPVAPAVPALAQAKPEPLFKPVSRVRSEKAPKPAAVPSTVSAGSAVPANSASTAPLGELVKDLKGRLSASRAGKSGPERGSFNGETDALASEIRRRFLPVDEGAIIAGAKLRKPVGMGNFGTVWEAVDEGSGQTVAVKIFRMERLTEGQMLARFMRSIQAMRLLSEEKRIAKMEDRRGAVVPFKCEDPSHLAFSMELLPGGNLETLPDLGWTLERKVEVMLSICAAVAYSHHNGVIHRDIKPANVVLRGNQQPVLTDFDIADIKWATSLSTAVEKGLGTPVFAAPEQLENAENANEQSDIYGLGRLLYFLLLERSPGYQIERDPSLDNLSDKPPALVHIVRRATQYDPRLRYGSVDEMMVALENYATGSAVWRARLARARRWSRHNWAALTIGLLLIGASSGIAVIQSGNAAKQARMAAEQKRVAKEAKRARMEAEDARAESERISKTLERELAKNDALVGQLDELRKQKSNYAGQISDLEAKLTAATARLKAAPKEEQAAIAKEKSTIEQQLADLRKKQQELDERVALQLKAIEEEVKQRERDRIESDQSNPLDPSTETTASAALAEDGKWPSAEGKDEYGQWAEFEVGGVRQRMRKLSRGTFKMGSPDSDKEALDHEKPQHKVKLTRGFWLADSETTQALWIAVMGDNPAYFGDDHHPVERVSWSEAQAFIKKLNARISGLEARLPTEAEWEYAARAGTTTARHGELDAIAWCDGGGSHEVKNKKPNAWGLFDMLGNVWEWTASAYGKYSKAAVTDPSNQAGAYRVFRGGSWGDGAWSCRAACRNGIEPDDRNVYLGLRLARGQSAGE